MKEKAILLNKLVIFWETTKHFRFRCDQIESSVMIALHLVNAWGDMRITLSIAILNASWHSSFKETAGSDSFVWIEHNSDSGVGGASRDVLVELDSDHTGGSVGVHNLTPRASVSGVVGGVLDLVNIGNSLTHVPLSIGLRLAVLDSDQSLVLPLMSSRSSETGEHTLLVQSNWLSFLVLFFHSYLSVLCHLSLF